MWVPRGYFKLSEFYPRMLNVMMDAGSESGMTPKEESR